MPRHPVARRLYQLVGRRVRQLREELHLTQDALARRIGAVRTTVSNLEAGRQHMPLHQLYATARALNVELVGLLPTVAEVGELEGTPREVGGVMKDVPAALEQTITTLLSGASEAADGRP